MAKNSIKTSNYIDQGGIDEIAKISGGPCVSIFGSIANDGKIAKIKYANAIKSVRKKLIQESTDKTAVGNLIGLLATLLDQPFFWKERNAAVAVFCAPGFLRGYRLLENFPDMIRIDNNFYLDPLKRSVNEVKFYILSLSGKQVNFYAATRDSIKKIEKMDLPAGTRDILPNKDFDRRLQTHGSGSSGRSELFHGQGAATDADKIILKRYFQKIDRALHGFLEYQDAPLVLAGVDYYAAMYRKSNTYPKLLNENVSGNPDSEALDVLRAKAWNVAAPHLAS